MSEFMKLAIVFISMLVLFYFLWVNGIHVIVENENKETILDLTPEIKTGMLTVDEKCRYFLIL